MVVKNCSYPFADYLNTRTHLVFVFIVWLVILVVFTRYSVKRWYGWAGIALLTGGAAANALERLTNLGCVSDYLSFFSLFSFNLPDVMIAFGMVLVIINIWKAK
jgi:lipoprotein signal peptidase